MSLIRPHCPIRAPAALPVQEAKAIARLDPVQEDDAVIAGYIRTATEATEQ